MLSVFVSKARSAESRVKGGSAGMSDKILLKSCVPFAGC